ncbi:hypothetical protein RF11_09309 [Thelohanellus kitauei]|uniref:Uncharacterized protein n=1 Tax=Thelohanellus kitauei TaxID=669202 RepID=A0A0C2J6V6_THEKT|nr:hypothetical protein RF11_09309 [Thelohanellus kitauei]
MWHDRQAISFEMKPLKDLQNFIRHYTVYSNTLRILTTSMLMQIPFTLSHAPNSKFRTNKHLPCSCKLSSKINTLNSLIKFPNDFNKPGFVKVLNRVWRFTVLKMSVDLQFII